MIIPLSDVWAIVVSVVAWPMIGWASGLWFNRRTLGRLDHDSWLTRPRSFERSGRFYRRGMRIHGWKDRLPEMGSLMGEGYSKAHLFDRSSANLERFVEETRRAELVHWANVAAGPLFLIWCRPTLGAFMIGFGVVAHLPFIAVQRYNRARFTALLDRRQARRERKLVRHSHRTTVGSPPRRIDQRVSPVVPISAWAAASRAMGTRNGEHDT